MYHVFNMELEIVRTVLKNEINAISVCADLKSNNDDFYTLISISNTGLRKKVVALINGEDALATNSDFIGSFTMQDNLNLVFAYKKENILSKREAIYISNFADRKRVVTSLLVSCAEAEIYGELGKLLINDRNINIAPDGKIYFNYFLDFADLKSNSIGLDYYNFLAEYSFKIIAREYELKYDENISEYPDEIQLFSKKIRNNSFKSYNLIITFIKMMSDKIDDRKGLWAKFTNRLSSIKNWLSKKSLALFVLLLVIMTITYTAYQIAVRSSVNKSNDKNTAYNGVNSIGDVYLGEID